MGLPGVTDSSVYEGLSDVLRRQPEVTSVTYEPDSITRRVLRAQLAPDRPTPPTGPQSPTLEVEWRYAGDEQCYRIHYADPIQGSTADGTETKTTLTLVPCTSSTTIH